MLRLATHNTYSTLDREYVVPYIIVILGFRKIYGKNNYIA